jgi:mxaC protein
LNLAFDHPAVLLLLVFALPALFRGGTIWIDVPALLTVPEDAASRGIDVALRSLAALPIGLLVLVLAGLHEGEQVIWRTGRGAHVMVVLDRSLSMDEAFSVAGEKAKESKTEAAARMIAAFFATRPHDVFGLVAFSTSPILAMPLTTHRDAAEAAIAAMNQKGLANTEIGGGIALGLAQFKGSLPGAANVLLLVTDGAGVIPIETRNFIKAEATRLNVHLYYLYLRAGDDPPLAEDIGDDVNLGRPSGLDAFFRGLGVNYAGFEARDPGAVQAAARKIDALETQPILYRETLKRRDLDAPCIAAAAICLLLSLLAQMAERRLPAWPVVRRG